MEDAEESLSEPDFELAELDSLSEPDDFLSDSDPDSSEPHYKDS